MRLIESAIHAKSRGRTNALTPTRCPQPPAHPNQKPVPRDAADPKSATPPGARSGMNFKIVGGHLAAFAVGDELEVHFLAFAQVTQTGALHGTDMNKSVRPTLVGCDKAEALLGVEPLDGPSR